ncbi:MAG: DUF1501 domain-containing protein [Thermoleophilia bacterium]
MSDEREDEPIEEGAAPDPGAAEAIRCADCARSDSLVRDLDPVDAMPIPVEAAAGFPDGVPRAKGLDRRAFLRTGVLGMASVYAATRIDWTRAYEAAVASAAEPSNQLVMIFLNGGNDGLNTVVPLGAADFDRYRAARPNLARGQGPSTADTVGTTAMPGTGGALGWANVGVSGTGNNGDTRGFDTLWGDGSGGAGSDLAVWPAADYTPANRSHFDSRDYWFAGALEKMTTGWLGRWLDLYGSPDNPLQAVSIDSSISKQIRTAKAPVSAVRSLTGVEFRVDGVSTNLVNTTDQMAGLAAVPVAGASNDALRRSRDVFGRTVQVARSLRPLTGAPAGGGYPNSNLSQRLQLAATLLGANLGVKVVTIDWGSFDTHGNQLGSQDPQLTTLSRALAAFQADLVARGIEGRVMTVVFSEFGRRVASNNTGTDHGAGGLMMAMGSGVRGGLRGEFPGLATLDRGDLRVTTDFRAVYSAIVAEWLGGDPRAVIPGGPFGLGAPLVG